MLIVTWEQVDELTARAAAAESRVQELEGLLMQACAMIII